MKNYEASELVEAVLTYLLTFLFVSLIRLLLLYFGMHLLSSHFDIEPSFHLAFGVLVVVSALRSNKTNNE